MAKQLGRLLGRPIQVGGQVGFEAKGPPMEWAPTMAQFREAVQRHRVVNFSFDTGDGFGIYAPRQHEVDAINDDVFEAVIRPESEFDRIGCAPTI